MSRQRPDFGLLSTDEIMQIREDKLEELRRQGINKEGNVLNEIERMSSKGVQEYLVTKCSSITTMNARILKLKALQNIDNGYLQILQIHGLVKFNDLNAVKTVLKESLVQHGSAFLNRVVKYISQFCFNQANSNSIALWSAMIATRSEFDWLKAFNNSVLSSPDRELSILSAHILLLPDPSSKNVTRVFAGLAKQEKLPECFEILVKRAFQFVSGPAFNKSDVEKVMQLYLFDTYRETVSEQLKNKRKLETDYSQNLFLARTLQIANKAFGIVKPSDENAAHGLLEDPCFQMNQPSNLFIEYFLQYIKLGMFVFENGDKIIAWNYYYDDRWCGYDRSDLFGEKFQLSESFKWFADFKYAGTIKQHPHYASLIIGSKVFQWMSHNNDLFNQLMKKYGNEDLVQFFCISLSFAGCFKEMIELYNRYKRKMRTRHGWLCLRICYLYSCAKEGKAKEALFTWVSVMMAAEKLQLLRTLKFPYNSFPLPYFVHMRYSGQFATRLLRNCLWTAALRDGSEGWKKYGMIIINLCDSLEDSFLNHNMIRILFQKISLDDMKFIVRPGLEQCINQHHTYWSCLQIAKARGFNIPKSLFRKHLRPVANSIVDEDEDVPEDEAPGFLSVFKKLTSMDEMFYSIALDLPPQCFPGVSKENFESLNQLPDELQQKINEIIEINEKKKEKEKEVEDSTDDLKEEAEEMDAQESRENSFFRIDDLRVTYGTPENSKTPDSDNERDDYNDDYDYKPEESEVSRYTSNFCDSQDKFYDDCAENITESPVSFFASTELTKDSSLEFVPMENATIETEENAMETD